MLQRARGLVPASSRVLGGTFHSVAHRLVRRHASALGLPCGFGVLDAGDAADVLDLLREEHGHAQAKTRFPRKGTLLDIYSRTVNAQEPLSGVVAEHFPWCRRPSRGDLGAVQGLHRAQAGARRDRPRRPAAVLARARGRRGDRAAAGGVVRPRARRRVPGRQRSAGGHRALAGRVRPEDHRGRRRLPGDLRLPLGLGGAHPRLPGPFRRDARGDAGAQLPLDAAGPGRRQRRGGAGRRGRSRSGCAPTVPAAPARA